MKSGHKRYHNSGMTLVEILIAMLIGAIMLAGILGIFINTKQTNRSLEAVSRIQENSRFALDFIARDLRMGDFWGCLRRDMGGPVNNINFGAAGAVYDFYGAGGFSGTNGVVNAGNTGLDAPDSLTIRGAASVGVFVAADNGVTITTTANHGFNPNDYLFITDCKKGDIFQATAGTAGTSITHTVGGLAPGNTTPNLSATYGSGSQVYQVATVSYSIANGASGLPSLFRSINGTNRELIEGVENMQVLYGIDDDATMDFSTDFYVPFNQIPVTINTPSGNVPGINRVISIRISLLLQSIANNITDQNTVVFYNGGTSVADRRIRRVVTSTIALRNRL